jgi:hypothetical protein
MRSRLSSTFQFFLGFLVGVAFLAGVVAVGLYIYVSKMTVTPDKPDFAEEKEPKKEIIEVKDNQNSEVTTEFIETETISEKPDSEKPEVKTNSETPKSEKPEAVEEEELLPPDAYRARVTWPQGLSLRAEPNINGAQIGGIAYNAEIIILEETEDKGWQKIRLPWSNQEGWVKGGNVERIHQ